MVTHLRPFPHCCNKLRAVSGSADVLVGSPPGLIIADEAHRLRKQESLATRGIRNVESQWIWELSGTPVERDAEDLAVLMSILDPRRFSPDDRTLHPTALRARTRPYILRQHKDDVLGKLPPVLEREEELELTEEQRNSYRSAIVEHAKGPRASFLPLFNELRAICDIDPVTGASSKLDRVEELLDDIAAVGEKAVVFSYLLAPLHALAKRLDEKNSVQSAILTGDMSVPDASLRWLSSLMTLPVWYYLDRAGSRLKA